MDVVGHNYKSQCFDLVFTIYQVHPVVNKIIGVSDLKKRYPTIAREGNKPCIFDYLMLSTDGH